MAFQLRQGAEKLGLEQSVCDLSEAHLRYVATSVIII